MDPMGKQQAMQDGMTFAEYLANKQGGGGAPPMHQGGPMHGAPLQSPPGIRVGSLTWA